MKRRSPIPNKQTAKQTLFSQEQKDQAILAKKSGNLEPLIKLAEQLLAKDASDLWAALHYGVYLSEQGESLRACALMESGLDKHPKSEILLANLSGIYTDLSRFSEAVDLGRKAVEINPANTHAWLNLSTALDRSGNHLEAETAARHALEGPQKVHAWNSLGNALRGQGRMREAVEARYRVLELDPDFRQGHTNLLLDLLYFEDATTEEIANAAFKIGQRLEAPLKAAWPKHDNSTEPWRRLRIGFISPDFRQHSAMYFAEVPLARLDREQFEIYCYASTLGDQLITPRIRRFADHWRNIAGHSPERQAQTILNDHIDVLIDLAGHTGSSVLPTMALKPAPVQISWMGYPGTTGLTAIDWMITDDVIVPAGEERFFTEQLVRLPPPQAAYRPLILNPILRHWPTYQVNPTPALENGYVTFGCCNHLAKLTDNTLKTWSGLLQRLPTARLLIEGPGLHIPEAMAKYRKHLLDHGIPDERLILIPRDQKNQYLTYHRIDIALDPFPLGGGTTSEDLLWMGVPLVTMTGPGIREKLSHSLLVALNRQEWVAHNAEEYLAIAERLASDIDRLNSERLQQRLRMERSPLMDETAFSLMFGEAIRRTWLDWCAKNTMGENPYALDGQIKDWLDKRPPIKPTTPLVYLSEGERIPLNEARQHITTAVMAQDWPKVRHYGLLMIESYSKEPVALMSLAEMEYAAGNLTAARVFASHAIEEAPDADEWYQRLSDWHLEAGNEQEALRVLQVLAARLTRKMSDQPH